MEKATLRLNLHPKSESRGRLVPTIIFIVLPGIYIISGYYLLLNSNWDEHAVYLLTGFYMISLATASVVYGLTALRHSTEKTFKKNTVIEFEYVKKIIVVEIFYLAAFATYAYLAWTPLHHYLATIYQPNINLLVILPTASVIFTVPGALLWIILHAVRKEFRFYFAKVCFIITSKEEDDYKKIKYLFMGLSSYNKYLRRKFKLEIGDIKKIYSKFLYAETAEKQHIIKSVLESVEVGDGLKLARYLSSLSKIPDTELFVSEAPLQKLKTIGTILLAVIPIIISAIELFKAK